MRSLQCLDTGWIFREGFDPARAGERLEGVAVSLPHNALDLPYNYFDERSFQKPFTYQRVIGSSADFADREVSLHFEGAMADAVVYLNGEEIAAHKDGYTPFEARLTGRLHEGDNIVTVKIDGSENPEIPPFGGRIDYLTYAGLYRDVWLRVTAPVFLRNIKIETHDVLAERKAVSVRCDLGNPQGLALSGRLTARLSGPSGETVAEVSGDVAGESTTLRFDDLENIKLWDVDDPQLYRLAVVLETPNGSDEISESFGFRTAEFTSEGFKLNGRLIKLRGLNRHQSFPYVGYAMGDAAQVRDAEIVKRELHCNIVRTSHYPQAKSFIAACDRLGLLVFEEIPGWQHIGGEAWKREAVENVRRMIERDWNHPSVVIWGVRINESQDDHDFYAETNRLARELDPTRQTGGVRFITDSELLEDVYTMNDFILGAEELPGANRPRTALRPQGESTGLKHNVPYLITEYGGHMYPTKSFDQESRQDEHVRRHLEVLDAAYGDPTIAGCIGWCLFDYNTHKDFGAGDRICHHGVLDMMREPKFAAYAYKSQCDPAEEVVLQPVTFWSRGERNIGGVLPLTILTNCDAVELKIGGQPPKRAEPDRARYPHLPHPPVTVDHRLFTKDELGLWGSQWRDVEITGIVDGKPARTLRMVADPVATTLQVAADRTVIKAARRDSTRVIVRALDQAGNKLPFFDESVSVRISGPGKLVGPANIPFRGGSLGFWVESTNRAGRITVEVSSERLGTEHVEIEAGCVEGGA